MKMVECEQGHHEDAVYCAANVWRAASDDPRNYTQRSLRFTPILACHAHSRSSRSPHPYHTMLPGPCHLSPASSLFFSSRPPPRFPHHTNSPRTPDPQLLHRLFFRAPSTATSPTTPHLLTDPPRESSHHRTTILPSRPRLSPPAPSRALDRKNPRPDHHSSKKTSTTHHHSPLLRSTAKNASYAYRDARTAQ